MPLNDFVALVDPEGGGAFGGTAEPASGITATGFFAACRADSALGCGIRLLVSLGFFTGLPGIQEGRS